MYTGPGCQQAKTKRTATHEAFQRMRGRRVPQETNCEDGYAANLPLASKKASHQHLIYIQHGAWTHCAYGYLRTAFPGHLCFCHCIAMISRFFKVLGREGNGFFSGLQYLMIRRRVARCKSRHSPPHDSCCVCCAVMISGVSTIYQLVPQSFSRTALLRAPAFVQMESSNLCYRSKAFHLR